MQPLKWGPKQTEALHSTRHNKWTLFGGGKGGGKTVGGVNIYAHDVSQYKDGVFVVMRKNKTVLDITTKESFRRFFPDEMILNKKDSAGVAIWDLIHNNQLWFWAADITKDPDYEKTRGVEASAIIVDQFEEFPDLLYQILPSLLRRPAFHVETGTQLPGYIYATCNPKPGRHWLKKSFIDSDLTGHKFIQSLAKDNPLLPEGYLESAFSEMSKPLRDMLERGLWDVDEASFKVILNHEFDKAVRDPDMHHPAVAGGVDIGLGRPDKTIIYAVNKFGHAYKQDEFEIYDTMEQYQRIKPFVEQIKMRRGKVRIDSGGIGKGVYDRLRGSFGSTIQGVDFAGGDTKPVKKLIDGKWQKVKQYKNKRAEIYFDTAEGIRNGQIGVQFNTELAEEIDVTYYKPEDGAFQLVDKKEIKLDLGRSPDHADAFALACSAFLDKTPRIETWGESFKSRPRASQRELLGYD